VLRKTIVKVVLAVLGAASVGCSSPADCESICKAEQDGKCTAVKNCSKFCADTKKVIDGAGCPQHYQEALDCANSASDVCAQTECADQSAALQKCVAPFCGSNKAECAAPTKD
jgi:hypothetical protein